MRDVGARLPAFLDGHASAGERPWLAELARLEWARLEVFDAADARAPHASTRCARPRPTRSLSCRACRCEPAHALVRSRASPSRRRGARRRPAAARRADAARVAQALHAFHRPIEPLEADGARARRRGRPFGAVCDLVMERVPADDAPRVAFELLLRWVSDGLLAAAS